MDPIGGAVAWLEGAGFFTLLAYLLLLILFYYLFLHLIEKYIKRITKPSRKKVLSAVLSLLLDALLFVSLSPYSATAGALIAGALFVILLLLVVFAAVLGLLGMELPAMLRRKGGGG